MHIVCPHCTTSYAIDLATLGGAGRTVRCSRCKEVWLARPEDAIEVAAVGPGNGGRRRPARRGGRVGAPGGRGRHREPGHAGRRQPLDIGRLARRRRAGARLAGGRTRRSRRHRRHAVAAVALASQPVQIQIERRDAGRAAPRTRKIAAQPALCRAADGMRRDGRAGAGAGDLARRRGAAAAADRDVLQDGRPRGQSARADVQGRQDHAPRPWKASRCW